MADHIEQLLVAAGGDERGLAELTDKLGLDEIAPLLVDEIAFRANAAGTGELLPDGAGGIEYGTVALRIHHHDAVAAHLLTVGPGGTVTAREGVLDEVSMRLDYELHDLVRVLLGPERPRPVGTHAVEFLPPPQPGNSRGTEHPAPEKVYLGLHANATVMAGLSTRRPEMNELARRYKTDKWSGVHWFTGLYERHLGEFRDLPVRILEIGVGGYGHPTYGGESLRMWKRYFHRGLVFGIDKFDKSAIDEQRLRTLVADQGDPDALAAVDDRYGPFDIVIDDGSHINEHVRNAFATLFPRLRSGGIYVIEDLWTAYCPGYGGEATTSPGATTSVGMLRDLLDGLQYEEQPHEAEHTPSYTQRNVAGLHVYRNVAFLEKGTNAEGGVPAWVPRSPLY